MFSWKSWRVDENWLVKEWDNKSKIEKKRKEEFSICCEEVCNWVTAGMGNIYIIIKR